MLRWVRFLLNLMVVGFVGNMPCVLCLYGHFQLYSIFQAVTSFLFSSGFIRNFNMLSHYTEYIDIYILSYMRVG